MLKKVKVKHNASFFEIKKNQTWVDIRNKIWQNIKQMKNPKSNLTKSFILLVWYFPQLGYWIYVTSWESTIFPSSLGLIFLF